ncbi:hypothetical protein OA383_01230 [Candidatus Pelagibacter bacterium]|nr:hypothetical protein [Candidatus Pelagibacter bacterium]
METNKKENKHILKKIFKSILLLLIKVSKNINNKKNFINKMARSDRSKSANN